MPSLSKIRKFESEIYGCVLKFTQICRYTFKFKGAAMDVKLNINLNSNLMSVGKSSAATSAVNLNAGALNLKSGDRGDILRGASNLPSGANEAESSADILKKQLEKLQKRLKELEAAIKRIKASKNPYAKDMAASLETQKGAVFAQIMQISARILEMQGSQSKI
ncbi:hypothetical protein CSHOW_0921 [Campylobacter showae]|uniref:Uncharacterized protein n=2 Tax=Campylobacter showae TaxID=204 RepID=C6RFD2_9BACT|nr:hypothetical protein CAMSH0001_0437 [Campylobacter showae RM3277]QCD48859.1 hypothetical protein CSHOW_0921 [Campylobacter showae]